jgi:hypothetical protein
MPVAVELVVELVEDLVFVVEMDLMMTMVFVFDLQLDKRRQQISQKV